MNDIDVNFWDVIKNLFRLVLILTFWIVVGKIIIIIFGLESAFIGFSAMVMNEIFKIRKELNL